MNELSASTLLYEVNTVMDRIAEYHLKQGVGISYSRFAFLSAVEQYQSATQHQIAQALRISDPASSKLCAEAARDGLIAITTNPAHKRQRLVSLTLSGKTILQKSMTLLDGCFSDICERAGVDEVNYRQQTALVLDSLNNKYKEMIKQ
ncbi:MAG TPA: MarR family transcriptional regulator [Candidatus Saccharimonadales bacterium]|nr:MarR family transcriptional regulator [Candidatus Saccharimonadales bacterium]